MTDKDNVKLTPSELKVTASEELDQEVQEELANAAEEKDIEELLENLED
jgi:hypothetical protein|tara:strand:+ start:2363 stop:2509 length:147 start_codon:yes stop_codon:yes gene_type:complete